MRRLLHRLIALTLVLAPLAVLPRTPAGAAARQTVAVAAIMAQMTPAEKVGQLFLVTFDGPSAAPGTDVERLITEYHVGGVVLLADHDNITDTADAPQQVLTLTNQLQSIAVAAAQIPRDAPPGQIPAVKSPPFIPLLIATRHQGDGYPFTEIRSGLTELPDPMAVGATWNPEQAAVVGRITGEELSALGLNLLIGPPLDLLETPRPRGPWDLGASTFGGNGFWVGQMGQAYIRGVHAGSARKVAVVSTHFPGHGSSDRNPDDEVPTILRTLDQLRQMELVPFFAVTVHAPDAASTTDGLLTAHIRFKGFQPTTGQTASPVSLDQQALSQLLGLPELAAWRSQGGVTVSDSLGARAVKQFYENFNNRRVAREAFTAGNDLLYLSDFGVNPRLEQTANITDTIAYFTQQYEVDRAFRDRVDAAVERILTLKLRLSEGGFDPAKVERPQSGLAVLGHGDDQVRALAQSAATLVGLTPEELAARVPAPPVINERIVFFTDTRQGRQCAACPPYPLLDRRALERTVVRFYGPSGSDQIRANDLLSFGFDDLAGYLGNVAAPAPPPEEGTPTPEPSPVETALLQADWIVFAMLDAADDGTSSGVVSTFLKQRPDLARSKKILVFGFSAPYYLDTTDLNKLTAFYALYSKAPVFVDVAAQLLFREFTPRGAPPVSVPSVDYDLAQVVAPDPKQTIEILSDKTQDLKVGDALQLKTGVILDHNGHPVPDGTPVRFSILYKKEGLGNPNPIDVFTQDGVATTSLVLDRSAQLEITASSDPAFISRGLQIIVLENERVIVITVTPPPTPFPGQSAPSVTPPAPIATPEPTPTPPPPRTSDRVQGGDFFLLILGLVAVVVAGYRLSAAEAPPSQRVRIALAGAIGALVGFNFYALGLPGADIARAFGVLAASAWVFLGAGVGLVTGWVWFARRGR
ncbi:MAG: putative Glycosidase [Anaerolineales bacterium]|nr:putative Glycosidase [Anaerolineales bacterium]